MENHIKLLQAELSHVKETNDIILSNLKDAYAESELYHTLWRNASPCTIDIDTLERLGSVDHSDHSSLDYRLNTVQYNGRYCGRADIRMVKRQGRPGMVIFSSGQQLLSQWKPHGEEQERSFMIFVPEDDLGRDTLTSATTHDYILIRDCVTRILEDLQINPLQTEPTDWTMVCLQMLQNIDELPQRIHYDHVRTSYSNDKNQEQINFQMLHASYKGRLLPPYSLHLNRLTGAVLKLPIISLALQLKTDRAPLARWPLDGLGRFQPSFTIASGAKLHLFNFSQNDLEVLYLSCAEITNLFSHLKNQNPHIKITTSSYQAWLSSVKTSLLRLLKNRSVRFAA